MRGTVGQLKSIVNCGGTRNSSKCRACRGPSLCCPNRQLATQSLAFFFCRPYYSNSASEELGGARLVQRINSALRQVILRLLHLVLRVLQALLGLRWCCADDSSGDGSPQCARPSLCASSAVFAACCEMCLECPIACSCSVQHDTSVLPDCLVSLAHALAIYDS